MVELPASKMASEDARAQVTKDLHAEVNAAFARDVGRSAAVATKPDLVFDREGTRLNRKQHGALSLADLTGAVVVATALWIGWKITKIPSVRRFIERTGVAAAIGVLASQAFRTAPDRPTHERDMRQRSSVLQPARLTATKSDSAMKLTSALTAGEHWWAQYICTDPVAIYTNFERADTNEEFFCRYLVDEPQMRVDLEFRTTSDVVQDASHIAAMALYTSGSFRSVPAEIFVESGHLVALIDDYQFLIDPDGLQSNATTSLRDEVLVFAVDCGRMP